MKTDRDRLFTLAWLAFAIATTGCVREYHPEYHPETTYTYVENVITVLPPPAPTPAPRTSTREVLRLDAGERDSPSPPRKRPPHSPGPLVPPPKPAPATAEYYFAPTFVADDRPTR